MRRLFAGLAVFSIASVALFGVYIAGCNARVEPPIVVTPSAMIRMYRDSPAKADAIYTGRLVYIPLRRGEFRILNHPPVIVSDPPPDRDTRMTLAVCTGRREAEYRGDRCYFVIVLESANHED